MTDIAQLFIKGVIQPADAEPRFTADGKPVLTFRVVVNRPTKNRQTDAWEDNANWFRVTLFGPQAERLAPRMTKGTPVLVTGKFQAREWQDNSGATRTSLEIMANEVIDLRERRPQGQAQPEATEGGSDDLSDLPF